MRLLNSVLVRRECPKKVKVESRKCSPNFGRGEEEDPILLSFGFGGPIANLVLLLLLLLLLLVACHCEFDV